MSPPEIRKPPQGGFFISADTGRRTRKSHANGVGSTMSKRAKRSAGDVSGMPRSRCFAPCEGVPVSPPKIQRPLAGRLIFAMGRGREPKMVRGEAKGAHGAKANMGIYSPCVPTRNKKTTAGWFFLFLRTRDEEPVKAMLMA